MEPRLHPNVLPLTPLCLMLSCQPSLVAVCASSRTHTPTLPSSPFPVHYFVFSLSSFCRALIYLALRCVYVPMHLLFSLPHVFPPFASDCVTPLDNAPLSLCLPRLDSPHTHTRRLHCHPHPHLHQVSCKLHTL